MIDLYTIDDTVLNQTMRLLKREAMSRGWRATLPSPSSIHIFLVRSDGKKIHSYGPVPPTTSFAAAHTSTNKYVSYQQIKEADIPQLATTTVRNDNMQAGVDFLNLHKMVVVKPVDGAHGNGITVGVKNQQMLEKAVDYALSSSNARYSVLLQQQYPHKKLYDLRILCIDYQFVAAIYRVPAAVIGDGKHTIEELILAENQGDARGVAYMSELATIDLDLSRTYLKETINNIPVQDEIVEVLGIANYGAGGQTIDATDSIPVWLRELAELASKKLELPMAGIDFLSCAPPKSTSTKAELDAVFIEANKAPSLAIHVQPTHGTSRDVVKAYFDYLAKM
ncbi:hypothetical protein A2707_03170 [Candidatus Saccharibacteria bacterium RIFCSPHIGHO2_01_FULL_45_15]|nr:MAG: hypothetical protein A2707_03170 [Candidatus Saccharibacteria bacterium RIFCSPHIGHO2_01_FULL_45_15]OGL28461.1 MAG: hypothetical protein A3C39_02890 [Candidatus Saccharibacteria bacterium RIFCSPHIGHO2_02_FULL_46_12]OGL32498.1 MAG: hypothetical protein A3E76_00400 [Candidatus Saccharibacteria bacterium RIFCSPHIGHO2_12_FULL_44_22]